MAKAEWGAKHTCLSCSAKFYDMGRSPITCPACDVPFATAAPARTRRARKVEAKVVDIAVAAASSKKASSDDGEDALIDDDDDDDDDSLDDDNVVVALTDDDDGDALAEADLSKAKISEE